MENGNRCQWNFDHVNNGKLFFIFLPQEFYIYKRTSKKRNIYNIRKNRSMEKIRKIYGEKLMKFMVKKQWKEQ